MEKRDLSDSELETFLKWCKPKLWPADMPIDERAWGLLCYLKYKTGIRTDELVTLEACDVDVTNGMLHVRRPAKGSNKRSCKVADGLDRLQALLNEAGIEGHLPVTYLVAPGTTYATRIKHMEKRWRVTRFRLFGAGFGLGLHCLRHTFAMRIYRKTLDVKLTQLALGHKSMLTTERYITHARYQDLGAIMKAAL